MRKILVVACTTGTLLFGGAGIANATVPSASIPTSTTTTVAAPDTNHHQDSDKTGLWGLAGLVGLLGLVGLKRRNDPYVSARTGATAGPGRGAGV
jgi:LPXTG-motif cell wall-anchored protein